MTVATIHHSRPYLTDDTTGDVIDGVLVDDGPLAPVVAGAFAKPVLYGRADASALTARLVRALDAAGDALAFAAELYRQAWTHRADLALGYRSWDVYVDVELGNLEALKIPDATRREMVVTLHDAGMPKKKIARALAVSDGTVRLDLKKVAAAATGTPLALAAAPTATSTADESAPSHVRAYAALAAAGTRGLTAPELGKLVRDLLDPGAFLSTAHRNRRVARLSVDEPTGTRSLTSGRGARKFAVYVAVTAAADPLSARVDAADGRAVEAPGRRRRACPA